MNLAITMTNYRRPAYTARVAESLRQCAGIAYCDLYVNFEPGYPETVAVFDGWDSCPIYPRIHDKRQGLNLNTRHVLTRASEYGADGFVHIEDDTVLAPDALEYFRWALAKYGDHPDVFNIAGYNKPKEEPPETSYHEVRIRDWFTCWGWAVTPRRMQEILKNWSTKNPKSFAWHLNKQVRGKRCEVHPQLSRVQNIGYEKGENGKSPAWYEENHKTPWVANAVKPAAWQLRGTPHVSIQ